MEENLKLTFDGRIRSVKCALKGIKTMISSQQNAWIHSVATLTVIALGIYVNLGTSEWCWILVATVLVWTAEALNTAFEFITDVASPNFHPLAAKAKDVAAGAVLIAAAGAALIGLAIFSQHFSEYLNFIK